MRILSLFLTTTVLTLPAAVSDASNPTVHTDFPGGQLGKYQWVVPGHLRATLYREWDENHVNTQATWYYFRLDGRARYAAGDRADRSGRPLRRSALAFHCRSATARPLAPTTSIGNACSRPNSTRRTPPSRFASRPRPIPFGSPISSRTLSRIWTDWPPTSKAARTCTSNRLERPLTARATLMDDYRSGGAGGREEGDLADGPAARLGDAYVVLC